MFLNKRLMSAISLIIALVVVGIATPAKAFFIDWDIYHNYSSLLSYSCGPNTKASVPLRYGSTGSNGFGLYHIEEGHGDFTSTKKSYVGQTLAYGRITYQTNQHTYRYNVGAGGTWRVVVSTLCQSPQDNAVNGIITAFKE